MMGHRAVFLDRDGTINEDCGYPGRFDQIRIYPYSLEAVRMIREAGFKAVVVTNQSGVGRGFFTEDDLHRLHERMADVFEAENTPLDAFYYCPHFEGSSLAEYNKACSCRKPATGMIRRAAEDLGLDPEASYMIGDKVEDILLGVHAGALPILVLTGYGRESLATLKERGIRPAFVAETLLEAARWIVRREKGETDSR